jgi:hypothetical protein
MDSIQSCYQTKFYSEKQAVPCTPNATSVYDSVRGKVNFFQISCPYLAPEKFEKPICARGHIGATGASYIFFFFRFLAPTLPLKNLKNQFVPGVT